MHLTIRLALLVLAVLFHTRAASAQAAPADWHALAGEATTSLAAALDDAARGRPSEPRIRASIRSFDRLLEAAPLSDRDRARVLYNRALASLSLGDAGSAIIDLRRADALAPGRLEIARELAAARSRLAEQTAPASTTMHAAALAPTVASDHDAGQIARAWLLRVSPGTAIAAALVAAGAAWFSLTARLFVRRGPIRGTLTAAAAAGFALGFVALSAFGIRQRIAPASAEIVIAADSCLPRQGPDELAYPPAALAGRSVLPRGTELVVLEARGLPDQPGTITWLRVGPREQPGAAHATETSSAWIPASAAAWIGPAPSRPFIGSGSTAHDADRRPIAQPGPQSAPPPHPRA